MQNSPKNFVIIDDNVYFYDFFGFGDFRLTKKAKAGGKLANKLINQIENERREINDRGREDSGESNGISRIVAETRDEQGRAEDNRSLLFRGRGTSEEDVDLGVRQQSDNRGNLGEVEVRDEKLSGDNNRGLSEEQKQHAAKEFVASIAENGDFLKHRNIFQKIYDSILSFLGKHGINFGSRSKAVFTKKYIESLLRDAYKMQREGEDVID